MLRTTAEEMRPARRSRVLVSVALCGGIIVLAALTSLSSGQDPTIPQMPAPPPMKFMPRHERQQLEAAKDAKDRIRISIELTEGHLLRAEELTAQRKHDATLIEMGNYMALVEEAMNYLGTMKRDSNRTRDLYKRLELALRAQGLRLAAIRRITPLEYAPQIKAAEEFARNARTDALDSFYGHTVLREAPAAKRTPDKPAKEPTPGGPKRP